MPRPKLKEREVRIIKKMLLERNNKGEKVFTQKYISIIYGVARGTITKINKGITEPNSPLARWGDILLEN